jgi:hypothetical protein
LLQVIWDAKVGAVRSDELLQARVQVPVPRLVVLLAGKAGLLALPEAKVQPRRA